MNRVQKHKELCQELNKVYEQKNHDYGNSFGETFDKLGIISAVTRISDKYNRLVSLCTKSEEERKVKDESITDTLLDMANYCIMTVIEMHKNEYDNQTDNEWKYQEVSMQPLAAECKHDWQYEGMRFDNSTYERHRCSKCGKIQEIEIIGL